MFTLAPSQPRAEFPEDRKPTLGFFMKTDWQDALQQAIHESDPQIKDDKIRVAAAAIFARIDGLPGLDPLEEQALYDALGSVRILRSSRRLRNSHTEVR